MMPVPEYARFPPFASKVCADVRRRTLVWAVRMVCSRSVDSPCRRAAFRAQPALDRVIGGRPDGSVFLWIARVPGMAVPTGSAADIRLLASGLEWPEGPEYGADGSLYVANFASSGGRISRIAADGTVSEFVETGGAPNGLAFGPDGLLYVADAGRRAVLRVDAAGEVSVFATEFEGARFTAPNDLAFGPRGDLFVTDPLRNDPPDPCISPVYRIAPDGEVHLFAGDIPYPEGVAVSADGSEVFVTEMRSNRLLAFPLRPDGTAGEPRMVYRFRDPGWPVGMVVDTEGAIIVALYRAGALAFVSQSGELLDRWEREGSMPTDIGFGGPALRTIYVTDAAGKVETFEHGVRGLRFF